MNFRTEIRHDRQGVAFGSGSWVGIDHLGLLHPEFREKDTLDRQFYASAISLLNKALQSARTCEPGPYGKKNSVRRRKFCDRVASIANDLEATQP
tara:strand:+ start:2716 stop:3000 length:285 start_codon:yes stop_codon:yes gene_type:complete